MTITEPTELQPVAEVAFNTYRDLHEGIRAELFALTSETGRIDPADRLGRAATCASTKRSSTAS